MCASCTDRIHFLNTGNSDCILLESTGHFALIDAGEDTDYPLYKPRLNMPGYEDKVVQYLLEHCCDAEGIVTLDFILGTHAHSDHIGGFDTVILHPQIRVKQAYLRQYNAERVFIMERKFWDNQEVYSQMLNALKKTKTPVSSDFNGKSFSLGNFKITFLHSQTPQGLLKYGENINSVVTLVEKEGTKVLLAADMNYKAGDEKRVANRVGKIDLLKVGHHGYVGSTSFYLIRKTMPRYAIVPNYFKRIYPDVRFKLSHVARAAIYSTADRNGVIADIGKNGKIQIHTNIM